MAYAQKRSASEWLQVIESHTSHAGDGARLENLVCDIGPEIPEWDLKNVFHWRTWPEREQYFPESSPSDLGIDNVGIRLDGSLVAIQCKERADKSELTFQNLSTFAANSASREWTERWVVSKAQFGKNLEGFNRTNNENPLKLVEFVGPVTELALEGSLGVREDDELTTTQNEVVSSILKNLPLHAEHGRESWNAGEARGYIVLLRGTGKTRIAYRISKDITEQNNT